MMLFERPFEFNALSAHLMIVRALTTTRPKIEIPISDTVRSCRLLVASEYYIIYYLVKARERGSAIP